VRSKREPSPTELSVDQVREYLAERPNFLLENSDLLRTLAPPRVHSGSNIADFQRHMVERLQADLMRLDTYQDALIHATRSNLLNQQQTHLAVIAAFDAGSFEHLVHTITHDWVDILDVDAIALCLEDPFPADASFAALGIQLVEPGDIAHLMGRDSAFVLRGNLTAASRDVFGPAAPLIQAEALVKLAASGTRPQGLLALGSRNPHYFAPGQGTELLRFLGAITERLLDLWMIAHPPVQR